MTVDDFLGKRFKMDTSENFDEFMKALGVGLITRKAGNAVSPVVELKKNGDEYTLTSTSTFKSSVISFKPGVEFDEETMDGRKVKSTCTFEGNTLKQVQTNPDGKKTTIDREFGPEEMKAVMIFEGVTCTRTYKAQ